MARKQVAIVTGGGRGIGRAIAEELHRQGWAVVVADSGISVDGSKDASSDSDLIPEKAGLLLRRCDVRDPAATKRVVDEALERFGGLDALVNVAGISRAARLAVATLEDMHAVLDVNVAGTCNMIAAALPALRRRGGAILITSSTAGFLGSRRQPQYSAAKEALIGITRMLAPRLASQGIRVNALFPTGASRMSAGKIAPEPAGIDKRLHESFYDHDPRHIGDLAALLCRPEYAQVTGRLLLVASGHVLEFDAMRRFKTLGALASLVKTGRFPDAMSWVLGNPNLDEITPMPSRDFTRRAPVKVWEGVAELKTPAPPGKPKKPVTSLEVKVTAPRSKREGEVRSELPRAAAAVGAAMDRVWAALQQFVKSLDGRSGQALLELPAAPPWDASVPLVEGAVVHAMVGLLRGLSADDGRDNLRFNALMRRDASPAVARAVREYLLGDSGVWINGHVFALEGDSLSLVGAERAKWQSFCDAREKAWEGLLAEHLSS
jgi:NAD(P)-dependent dehydrogenase (short-subunit alcohol dehydrogenase family)